MAKLVKITPLSGGATMETHMTFNSQEDLKKHLETENKEKLEKKQAVANVLQSVIEQAGGERLLSIENAAKLFKWEDPGKKEVRASCNTLEKGWKKLNIDLQELFLVLDDGKGAPPVLPEFLQKCREKAKEDLANEPLMSLIAKPHTVELFAAMKWLSVMMMQYHIAEEMREDIDFKLGRMAALNVSVEDMWSQVLRYQHGFAKTLWEAVTFGKISKPLSKTPKKRKRSESESSSSSSHKRSKD